MLLFLFLGWLLFANLSDHYLWNDEASTAVMARNVLKFGYPSSFDGLNYHYPSAPDLNMPGTRVWIGDTWPQYYVMAASFRALGVSTWAARLPFALAGFLTLVLLYLFSIRYLKSREIGMIALVLAGTSVPFLLHARQARYYGLVMLSCVAIFYVYHRIINGKKGYFWLSLILTFLALLNYAAFAPIFCALWVMALFMDRREIKWRRFVLASVPPALFCVAWLSLSWFSINSDASYYPVNLSLGGIKKNLEFQIRTVNSYFAPLILLLSAVIFRPKTSDWRLFARIGAVLLFNIIFFSVFGLRTMRYYVQYIPFLCLIEAFFLVRVFQWRKGAGVAVIALLIFTNLLARPDKPRFYFFDYIHELTHEYTGPMEAVSKYLKANASVGDKVKIIKGDLEIIFYNPELEVLNDARYYKKTYPEWIVIRKYWNPIYEDKWRNERRAVIEDGYMDVLGGYEKILLPAVDSTWENSPDDLEGHFFRSPLITPENQMAVYHIKR